MFKSYKIAIDHIKINVDNFFNGSTECDEKFGTIR